MRRILFATLILAALGGCTAGSRVAKTPAADLVPNRAEARLLRLENLDPATERGQRRLRKMRADRERLDQMLGDYRDRKAALRERERSRR